MSKLCDNLIKEYKVHIKEAMKSFEKYFDVNLSENEKLEVVAAVCVQISKQLTFILLEVHPDDRGKLINKVGHVALEMINEATEIEKYKSDILLTNSIH